MILIDGAAGEGGGQLLRSALTLSIATGQPFRIENIRAGRPRPGLMRQHLTAALAAGEICGGRAEGAELSSTTLTFHPGEAQAGDYVFSIGSAGGAGLVFQTVFPALLMTDAPSTVRIEGGTHNSASPPFEFLRDSFLGALSTIDIEAELSLERVGYYPAGGGAIRAGVLPSAMTAPLDLTDRGELISVTAEAHISNLPDEIATREARVLREQLGLDEDAVSIRTPDSAGPGNVVLASLSFARMTEVYAGFGERGVNAKRVASRVTKQARRHLKSAAAVGPYLADQLLLPLALGAGGRFTMMRPSRHFETNAELIGRFLDTPIRFAEEDEGLWLVEVG